jgi:hypothetical protein
LDLSFVVAKATQACIELLKHVQHLSDECRVIDVVCRMHQLSIASLAYRGL